MTDLFNCRRIAASVESNAAMLHLSSVAAGVYYMMLRNSAGQSYHLTFVKE